MTRDLAAYENTLHSRGFARVAGADEAGRGPLAGPVVAACVVMPAGQIIDGVNDSKKLSEKRREQLYEAIMQSAESVGIGIVSAADINAHGISACTTRAFEESVRGIGSPPDYLVTDYVPLRMACPVEAMPKADANVYCVAAASIIAKVTRDRIMREMDSVYPQYQFARNKGYGTATHGEALVRYGSTPEHRTQFVRTYLRNRQRKEAARLKGAEAVTVAEKHHSGDCVAPCAPSWHAHQPYLRMEHQPSRI